MKNAQKPDHASLNTIIQWLKDGWFVIPDFQRDFEWRPWDILELMRSIFLDYYIGSLLLWKGKKKNFDALSCERIYGHENESNHRNYIVLDGQQRLTALYYVFMAPKVPLPRRSNRFFYFIRVDKFMIDKDDEDAFDYEWGKRWGEIFKNKEAQYEAHIFPFSVIGEGGFNLAIWAQGYEEHWNNKAEALAETDRSAADKAKQHASNAKKFGEYMNEIAHQYQISYIELDQDLAVPKVCDIFTQVNSRGIQLDVFDLVNAMLKPKGLQLKHMWRKAEGRLKFVDTKKMNVYVLQVMSILKQAYCSPKYLYYLIPETKKQIRKPDGKRDEIILVPDISDFEKHWESAVDALESSIKQLRHPQQFGAISSNYFPYISILPAFSSLQAYTLSLPPKRQLDAQRKIRHWYWASVFMKRYSGAMESKSARDFLDVKKWIDDTSAEPGVISEFKNNLQILDLGKEVRPNTSVYNGVFNLLVIEGAPDFSNGKPPQYDDLDDHHIVPASKGRDIGIDNINTILNRTPLTAHTNRHVIRDRLPNEYLRDISEEVGESVMREIMRKHFVSPEALEILLKKSFTRDDFESFITERDKTLRTAIGDILK